MTVLDISVTGQDWRLWSDESVTEPRRSLCDAGTKESPICMV